VTRVLLIGGSGQLGSAIRQRWNDCDIVAPAHGEVPLEESATLRDALDRIRPDVLVNAAAFHDVDRCENEPERAFAVNAVAVGRAASLAFERSVLFVTISTDYVFDGKTDEPYGEEARPHPLSAYGASKLAGEYLSDRIGSRAFVVRTCGLYGRSPSSRKPLVERALDHQREDGPLRVVADVFASPTYAGDLAVALRRLIETEAYGLYHAVNTGPVSWYEFVVAAAELAGRAVPIEPISAIDWKPAAIRPRFSALKNARLGTLGIGMPSWRDGIKAYLQVR
jgi:dTDP-4-dehydrorhamnose reductase